MAERRTNPRRKPAPAAAEAKHPEATPELFEWIFGGLSAVVVIAVVGFLLYEAVTQPADPAPAIEVMLTDDVVATPGGHRVSFRAFNSGEATAADVVIEGELVRDGETVEAHEVTLDYLPSRSYRDGGLVFALDPAMDGEIELRATSYRAP